MDWHRRNLNRYDDHLREIKFSNYKADLITFEAFLHDGAGPPTYAHTIGVLKNDNAICTWLTKGVPTSVTGEQPLAGLRVILCPRNTTSPVPLIPQLVNVPAQGPTVQFDDTRRVLHHFPFSNQTFSRLLVDFYLHHSIIKNILRGKTSLSRTLFRHVATQKILKCWYIRSDELPGKDIVMSITRDESTNISYAIIHGCLETDIELLLEGLVNLSPNIFSPIIVPAIVLDLMRTKHATMIEEKVEDMTKYSNTTRDWNGEAGTQASPPPVLSNYNKLTQQVLQLHQEVGDLALAFAKVRKQIVRLLELIHQEGAHPNPVVNYDHERIKEQLHEMQDTYDDLERLCDQVIRDCDILMGAIYNLIAQKQNIVAQELNNINSIIAAESKELALAAKRDTASMKGIAFVTMAFLPGTFVASFFAIPLLRWDKSIDRKYENNVIDPRFKYYWAATVPLTFVVIVTWWIWQLLNGSSPRTQKKIEQWIEWWSTRYKLLKNQIGNRGKQEEEVKNSNNRYWPIWSRSSQPDVQILW